VLRCLRLMAFRAATAAGLLLAACHGGGGDALIPADLGQFDLAEYNAQSSYVPDDSLLPQAGPFDTMPQSGAVMTKSHVPTSLRTLSQGFTWHSLPAFSAGVATRLAVAPDGTLWAIDNQAATGCQPNEGNIWHFDGYNWYETNSVDGKKWGCASAITVDPNNQVLAVEGAHGTLFYFAGIGNKTVWNSIISHVYAGIAVALNYSLYVLGQGTTAPPGSALAGAVGHPLFVCPTPGPTYASCSRTSAFTKLPGLWWSISPQNNNTPGTAPAFPVQTNLYCKKVPCIEVQNGVWLSGVATGTPYAKGAHVFYYAPQQTEPAQLVQFRGLQANRVAAIAGGVFALAGTTESANSDEALNYFDFSVGSWSAVAGESGTSLAALGASPRQAGGGGNGPPIYLLNSAGAVFTALAPTIPVQFAITSDARTKLPGISGANTNLYVVAPNYGLAAGVTGPSYVLDPKTPGRWVQCSGSIPAIPFYNGTPPSTLSDPELSQIVNLPFVVTARIFIVNGTLNIPCTSFPAPWTGSADPAQSVNKAFDFVEIAWSNITAPVTIDTSQVNMIGLDLQYTLRGVDGTSFTRGMKAGAVSQIQTRLANGDAAWQFLATSQWSAYRILAPVGLAMGVPAPCPSGGCSAPTCPSTGAGAPASSSAPAFADGTFLDPCLEKMWQGFESQWLDLDPSTTGAAFDLYGKVDSTTEDFNFYTSQSTAGSPFVTIPNPFHNAYGINESATQQFLSQNGAFAIANGPYPTASSQVLYPQDQAQSAVYGQVANIVSTSFNRGIMGSASSPTTKLACTGDTTNPGTIPTPIFPTPTPLYENLYAAAVWNVMSSPAYGYSPPGAYNFPFADKCNLSTTEVIPGAHVPSQPDLITVQVNNS